MHVRKTIVHKTEKIQSENSSSKLQHTSDTFCKLEKVKNVESTDKFRRTGIPILINGLRCHNPKLNTVVYIFSNYIDNNFCKKCEKSIFVRGLFFNMSTKGNNFRTLQRLGLRMQTDIYL